MSAERDVTRIVRSWRRTDDHDSADTLLGIVLSRLDTTPQRRSRWPARRFTQLNKLVLIAGAASAALVIAILGDNLLPRNEVVGSPPTVAPSPFASPSPLPSPSATPITDPIVGTWDQRKDDLRAAAGCHRGRRLHNGADDQRQS